MRAFLTSLLLTLVLLPQLAFAQEPTTPPTAPSSELSSYELFYPIVAGKVRGDPLYFLKTLREWIVGTLILDDIRNSDYHLILSKKRLVETEKLLLDREDYKRAEKTIKQSLEELTRAVNIARKAAQKGRKVEDLYNALLAEGQKEATFLRSLADKIPEERQLPFLETASSMQDLVQEVEKRQQENP